LDETKNSNLTATQSLEKSERQLSLLQQNNSDNATNLNRTSEELKKIKKDFNAYR